MNCKKKMLLYAAALFVAGSGMALLALYGTGQKDERVVKVEEHKEAAKAKESGKSRGPGDVVSTTLQSSKLPMSISETNQFSEST